MTTMRTGADPDRDRRRGRRIALAACGGNTGNRQHEPDDGYEHGRDDRLDRTVVRRHVGAGFTAAGDPADVGRHAPDPRPARHLQRRPPESALARGARASGRSCTCRTHSATPSTSSTRTCAVVDHFAVGSLPQHVVPSWDLKTLYVTNDRGNTLTPIDPTTGNPAPRSRSKIRTTCTSRPTASTRSSSPNDSNGSTSATRTRSSS